MEVVSKQADENPTVMQFGRVAQALPNWGLPFCVELRFVFESPLKRYYVLDYSNDTTLGDLMEDGLPEPTVCTEHSPGLCSPGHRRKIW